MAARYTQYTEGRATNPNVFAKGDMVSHAPNNIMIKDEMIKGRLAMLWIKGTLFVRIT
jgi:hypothetical protein